MSAHIVNRQLLRWTLQCANRSILNQKGLARYHVLNALATTSRVWSSNHYQTGVQHNADTSNLKTGHELTLRSLLDMGFTDTQADQVCEAVTKSRGHSDNALSTLTTLFILGLNPSSVLKVLDKCPDLYRVKGTQFNQRISNLRKLGLLEGEGVHFYITDVNINGCVLPQNFLSNPLTGSLQRVVSYYPQILTFPMKRVNNVVRLLRERCLFTFPQATDILRDSPAVVEEDLGQLEYKFQYVYFRMGVKQAEMVRSKLFRVPLEEVRCRHCFLERRGLYQTPDKKGQTLILNPKLNDILGVNEETYLADVAMATQEEYSIFRKLMEKEWQEEEGQERGMMSGGDDEDEEEEEGEIDGYQKRRKR
ncbi:transcription termination factor 4, mitochondrial isoform X1 [Hypomesus transpacificus]|uniref:transcription termination factor 4, mitochondrial isoform X1 n=1 Tax=Hypomesus transpacificus TaxID=137520 RepID=UPI001F0714C2|nr:transcription termination factor 4, mitochondrial isoform X1 [Hypomesus transpacificus]